MRPAAYVSTSPADERRLAAYLQSVARDTGYARAALAG